MVSLGRDTGPKVVNWNEIKDRNVSIMLGEVKVVLVKGKGRKVRSKK